MSDCDLVCQRCGYSPIDYAQAFTADVRDGHDYVKQLHPDVDVVHG